MGVNAVPLGIPLPGEVAYSQTPFPPVQAKPVPEGWLSFGFQAICGSRARLSFAS